MDFSRSTDKAAEPPTSAAPCGSCDEAGNPGKVLGREASHAAAGAEDSGFPRVWRTMPSASGASATLRLSMRPPPIAHASKKWAHVNPVTAAAHNNRLYGGSPQIIDDLPPTTLVWYVSPCEASAAYRAL